MSIEEIQTRADQLQKHCHLLTERLIKENGNLSVQDCTNVWMYGKIAEIELLIVELRQSVLNHLKQ